MGMHLALVKRRRSYVALSLSLSFEYIRWLFFLFCGRGEEEASESWCIYIGFTFTWGIGEYLYLSLGFWEIYCV